MSVMQVISCGEPLSIGLRRYLEKAFRTEVINFYGASESLGVEQRVDEGMILFDDLNVIEVIDGEMYITCLYNFTQPLIRYHISDKLVLHKVKTGTAKRISQSSEDRFFTKADVLLCRDEDVMWFEKADGSEECLHPLSMEGFCIEGLRDYQFCQTSQTAFEMLAELGKSVEQFKVTREIYGQIRKLLTDKNLEEIQFSIRFVEQIIPDEQTGKNN